jgi:hypothetical protein
LDGEQRLPDVYADFRKGVVHSIPQPNFRLDFGGDVRRNPIPFTLEFQMNYRAGSTKGVCDTPLPFLRQMNGVAAKPKK